MPPCHGSGEELAGLAHHQQSCIFQVKRQLSRQSIAARTLRQAKSSTETFTSFPALHAPIQQVRRSRKPSGNDGNGSLANALGWSQCQTIPLPEESGAKAARAKSSRSRSRLLHSQRGKTRKLCAGANRDAALALPHQATPTRQGQRQEHRPPLCPGNLFKEPSPRAGKAESSLCKPSCQIHQHPHSLCGATASHLWEREEKPLGVTALLGMPGGRIPPLTPTPGAVTSWLSSPTP